MTTFIKKLSAVVLVGFVSMTMTKADTHLTHLVDCANQGVTECQTDLALAYMSGHIRSQDAQAAAKLFSAAAKSGDARAQWNLGMMYLFGNTVPQSSVRALELLSDAAKQDFPQANYTLGLLYKNGDFGVFKDGVRSCKYLAKACNHDISNACDEYALNKCTLETPKVKR
ncbi:tetratricopeptide repeat protein [Basilea psittacipulmonis]|uniref:tetratricopeptide repeat protein n=1 Tax=Basilea psittacipulmonis TaxID=1472345 RepID=UPI0006903A25|nr:tetratricopeptide repeat protein [Basilea psittacipulmonis]